MKTLGLLLGLAMLVAGCAGTVNTPAGNLPAVDHILVEVSNLNASIAFYHGLLGLAIQSNDGHFAMLAAKNTRVALWDKRWDWETHKPSEEAPGFGMYPHLKVADVTEMVHRAQEAGYRIIQKPRHYFWGTEAFIADPDGYIWALVNR